MRNICGAIGLFVLCAAMLPGCVSEIPQQSELAPARARILDGKAECVLMRDGKIYVEERGHGVSPLLELYKAHSSEMAGGVIVDKVIGRAAASIAICGKVRHVHGEVMSEDAAAFLKANGITSSQTLLVPRILNRKRNGLCPLEKSVEGIDDPALALTALKAKIASFQKAPSSTPKTGNRK